MWKNFIETEITRNTFGSVLCSSGERYLDTLACPSSPPCLYSSILNTQRKNKKCVKTWMYYLETSRYHSPKWNTWTSARGSHKPFTHSLWMLTSLMLNSRISSVWIMLTYTFVPDKSVVTCPLHQWSLWKTSTFCIKFKMKTNSFVWWNGGGRGRIRISPTISICLVFSTA